MKQTVLNYLDLLGIKPKKIQHSKINLRCPICGDSQKNKGKSRGWFLLDKDVPIYHCFNCEFTSNMYGFLNEINPSLAKKYQDESKTDFINGYSERKDEYQKTLELFSKAETKENRLL